VQGLHPVPPLSLWRGFAATFLTLWDEQRGRLVRFRDVVARGDYAATVARDGGHPEVYFAFDDEADARKFGAPVKAEVIGSHPG
jgi:hypothetical protein